MRRIRPHLTYANTMSTLAVFIALGGGAYAATNLPRNAVRTGNIAQGAVITSKLANRAVTSSKLAPGSVTSTSVKVGTLLAKDFKGAELLAGPQGRTGSIGKAGPVGPTGPAGKTGGAGPIGPSGPTGAVGPTGATGPLTSNLGTPNATAVHVYGYFMTTEQSANYAFGGVHLHTTATAGTFQLCTDSGEVAWVAYINGTRSHGTVTNCTSNFTVTTPGDFVVEARRAIIWGVLSGDSDTSNDYDIYGLSQL